jgi:hypothetical protein
MRRNSYWNEDLEDFHYGPEGLSGATTAGNVGVYPARRSGQCCVLLVKYMSLSCNTGADPPLRVLLLPIFKRQLLQ